jgi:hypothetical protein
MKNPLAAVGTRNRFLMRKMGSSAKGIGMRRSKNSRRGPSDHRIGTPALHQLSANDHLARNIKIFKRMMT